MRGSLFVRACVGGLVTVLATQAQAGMIVLVSDNAYSTSHTPLRTGDPEADFVGFLEGLGHTVIRASGSGETALFREDNGGFAAAAAFKPDLIIVSRVTNSGEYDALTQIPGWNGLGAPLLLMNPQLARNNRWKWINSSTLDESPLSSLNLVDVNHPFIADASSTITDRYVPITRLNTTDCGNGHILAATPDGDAAIVEWYEGDEFYAGSGQTAGGRRALFFGLPYHQSFDPDGGGLLGNSSITFDDLSNGGRAMLGQTINDLITFKESAVPEPGVMSLLCGVGLLLGHRRRRA